MKYRVEGMRLVQCSRCGVWYFNPRLDETAILDIYRGDYYANQSVLRQEGIVYGYYDYFGDRDSIQRDFAHRLRVIERHVHRGRALDVGCAYGFLLELLAERGWRAEGIEINPEATRFARDELGLDVTKRRFEDHEAPDGAYELIAMFDVLEHLPHPKDALVKAHRMLADDGLLAVCTVNMDNFVVRWQGPKWEDVRRAHTHLWLFSDSVMRQLLKDTGFDIVEVASWRKQFEVEFALRRCSPYSPRLCGLLSRLAERAGIEHAKIHVSSRSKLCYYARKLDR